jgi:hypothetical protein
MAGPNWDDLSPTPPGGLGGSTAPRVPVPQGLPQDIDGAVNAAIAHQTAPVPSWDDLSTAPPNQAASTLPGSHMTAERPGLWDRLKSVATDTIDHSAASAFTRWLGGFIPSTEDYVGGGDNSLEAQQARAKARIVQTERDRRDQYAGQTADDPWNPKGGTYLGDAARLGADVLGTIAGGTISDPTNLIAPGKGLLTRMAAQGGIGAGVDLATQAVEKNQGVRDDIDPFQAAVSGLAGAGQVGVLEGVPALRNWWRARGVDTAHVPDEAMVSGSLDGTIGGTGMTPDQVQGIMRGAGADMDQFSSPEAAAAAAQRVQAAQATPAPNLSTGMPPGITPAGIGSKRYNSYIDAAQPVSRVVPDDVTLTAAPEGTIRSDDAGGQAGLERTRAANQSVLDQAHAHLSTDPVVAEIMSSDVDPQVKIQTLADRLKSNPAAYTAPTADVARAPRAQSFMDRIRAAESGGKDAARNPNSSAAGRYQFTDPTFLQTYKARFGQDRPDAEILGRKNDGALQDTLMRDLTDRNARELRAAGQADSDGNLYLAHFLGRQGAVRALRADPSTPIVNLVGADAVKANRSVLEGKTAGDVIAWAHGKMGDAAPAREMPWRMSAPDGDTINGPYSGRSPPVDGRTASGAPRPGETTMGDFEDLSARSSPTNAQREAGVKADLEAPMGAGGSDRLFKSDVRGDEHDWEGRADAMHKEAFAKAQADLEAEWAQRAAQQGANDRFHDERVRGESETMGDPSNVYRGKYDQKPVRSPSAPERWHTTPEGFVAGASDKPVAFRNAKDAATWAAKNQMGGDFELHTWATNSKRIILRKREGSTYGDAAPHVDGAPRLTDQREPPAAPPAPAPKPEAPAPKPVDALTFLARKGGIRDDEGHNLRRGGREMQQFAPGGGHVFRQDGMSIDRAGEALHEAGYFTGERPSTADVLDLLHRAESERQYRPEDLADVQARQRDLLGDGEEQHAREQLHQVAAEHGHDLAPADEQRMVDLMGGGATAHEAYRTHHEEQIFNALDAMHREAGDQGYDFHDHPVGQNDRGGAPGSERPAGERSDAPTGAAEPGRPDADEAAAPSPGAGNERGGLDRDLLTRETGPSKDAPTRKLADHLNDVADRVVDKRFAPLARKLADLVGNVDVRFGGKGLPDDAGGLTRLPEHGPMTVELRNPDDATLALHEAVHVAVMSRYNELTHSGADSPHIAALNSLRERALKSYRAATDPSGVFAKALEDTDEFMAYGLSSPRFQQWLQSRGTAGLWPRFVNAVRSLLGLEPKDGSLLEGVLRHGHGLLDEAASKKPVDGALDGLGRVAREKFAHDPVDPAKPGPEGWKRIAGLVFEPDALEHDGPAIVDGIKSVFGDPKAAIGKVGNKLKAFGETALYSADGAARSLAGRFEAPTIAKLADIFHAEAGKTDNAVGRTYSEAVATHTNRYLKDIHGALAPFQKSAAAMGRIRDLLATPDKVLSATADERVAAGKVRDMLKDLLNYRQDAGEPIGEVRDGYFPRTTRFDKVAANPEGFRRAAERVYREAGHDDPVAASEALLVNAINGSMNISDAHQFGGGGKPSSAKAREFGKYADTYLRDFYETNPMRALADYAASAVRRAEEARRFGAVGRDGSKERLAWMKEHGDKTQWDVMKRQIQSELRANGADARGVMERVEAIRTTNLGHSAPGEVKAGATISAIHAWNQLGTLAQSTFASLPELAMGFVRGGPKYGFTHLGTTFSEFARNVRKLPASDARRYAEAAGAVGSDTAMDLLRARADDPRQTSTGTQRLLHGFYRKNGLEQWTDAGRTAAVKTGQRFVDALAHDLVSTNARTRVRAAGYLKELGVKDPEAFGASVRKGAPTIDEMKSDKGFAGDYSTALLRFANQSVLLPTRAVKPTWASHPLGSLLFALQSYNYAFKKNVLDRVGRETLGAIKERDPHKLAAAGGLGVLTATTALIQALRHTIYGTPEGTQDEGAMHYALETLDRTGVFGAASPLLNAVEGLRYKRSVGQVLQGAVIGRAAQGLDAIGGLATGNSDNTNSAERKAAGAVYDMVVKPAEDAIGAGVLKGPAGSALILGTGGRENGLVANDKGAFQTALAGPESERVEKLKDDETDE